MGHWTRWAEAEPEAIPRFRAGHTPSRSFRKLITAIALIMCAVFWAPARLFAQGPRVLDERFYYLGTAGDPEWQEVAGKTPSGRRAEKIGRAHVLTPVTSLSRMPSSACKKKKKLPCGCH